jgi:hypothetical protein
MSNLLAFPYNDPAGYEHLGEIECIRCITGALSQYERLQAEHPGLGVQISVQLAEFLREEDTRPSQCDNSIRHRLAILAQEAFGLVIDERDDEAWWGLGAARLDDVGPLDEYLYEAGRLIGSRATKDLQIADTVQIDTAAWTMPEKRALLGLTLTGTDLIDWIDARCSAFIEGYREGGASIQVVLNSLGPNGSTSLRLDRVAAGYSAENWGTRHYGRFKYPSVYEMMLAEWRTVSQFLTNPPANVWGFSMNPIPLSWRGGPFDWMWMDYMRTHAGLFVALRDGVARMRNVPMYFHTGYERSGKKDTAFWIGDYPIVAGHLIGQSWDRVRVPLREEEFVVISRETSKRRRLTLTIGVDPADQQMRIVDREVTA